MIPKIIHYCWFGRNPLPQLALDCIASWKKHLPDYEIKEWNEENFDVNMIPYTAEAYRQKKYAFVSDYARFWILEKYGGLYFDTDVEVIRPMDDIIANGPFMGAEDNGKTWTKTYNVNPGVGMGAEPHNEFIQEMITVYGGLHFEYNADIRKMVNIVTYTSRILSEMGLQNKCEIQKVGEFTIYTHDYFSPINTISERLHITENTRSIHHYTGSWVKKNGFKAKVRQILPEWALLLISKIKHSS